MPYNVHVVFSILKTCECFLHVVAPSIFCPARRGTQRGSRVFVYVATRGAFRTERDRIVFLETDVERSFLHGRSNFDEAEFGEFSCGMMFFTAYFSLLAYFHFSRVSPPSPPPPLSPFRCVLCIKFNLASCAARIIRIKLSTRDSCVAVSSPGRGEN